MKAAPKGGGGHPAIILASRFVQAGAKKYDEYIKYISRDEAVRTQYVDKFDLFSGTDAPGYGAYNDYMDNPEKQPDALEYNPDTDSTSALFAAKLDEMTPAQKKYYTDQFRRAEKAGSPMWQHVISFRNDWLQEQGLFDPQTKQVDATRLREVTRQAVQRMLRNEHMGATSVWTAAIHYNTDNIHIHIAVAEPIPSRPIMTMENGDTVYRGKLKQSTLDIGKSSVLNQIVDRQREHQHINEIIRNGMIAQRPSRDEITDHKIQQEFLSICAALPHNRSLWKYNMHVLDDLRPRIDHLTDLYLERYAKQEMREFKAALDEEENFLKSAYGPGEKEMYKNYRLSKEKDLYTRFGNSLLSEMSVYEKRRRETAREARSPQKYTGKSAAARHELRHRSMAGIALAQSMSALRKAIKKDIGSIKNQRAYEQLQYDEQRASEQVEYEIAHESHKFGF